jgi:hypothetical protein
MIVVDTSAIVGDRRDCLGYLDGVTVSAVMDHNDLDWDRHTLILLGVTYEEDESPQ